MGWILFFVAALIAAYLWSKQKALEKQSQQLFKNLAKEPTTSYGNMSQMLQIR